MQRVSHLPPAMASSPLLSVLRQSLLPTFVLSSPPCRFCNKIRTFTTPINSSLLKSLQPNSFFHRLLRVPPLMSAPLLCPKASFSTGSVSGGGREILVQHLLVKENDVNLLVVLQKRISQGEDLSDLAVEYSICPSKEEGGMLGWVRKGQMVPEFEETAFSAPLNQVVKCKTKFGWHLLQVLSEREESLLQEIQADELHVKLQDPKFMEEAQLIDVREPDEVEQASLHGFEILPLRQFGSWGPEILTKFDPEKDTYVMNLSRVLLVGFAYTQPQMLDSPRLGDSLSLECHHGMRSLQVAKWLQMQGFRRVYNVSGGIHAYAVKADPSIPTY